MTRSSTDLFGALILLSAFGMVSLDASGGLTPAPATEVARAVDEAGDEAEKIAAKGDAYCKEQLAELLQPGGQMATIAAQHALVITAPNALAPDTAAIFDSIVEAVVTTMMHAGYFRDRSWFPTRASQEGPAHCPGMMMFRHPAKPRLLILWVPESSLSGLSRDVMKTALGFIQTRPGQRPRLTVLGPYYSASAMSLGRALSESAGALCYRVASGTLQVAAAHKALSAQLATLAEGCADKQPFTSNAPTVDARLGAVERFLAHHGARNGKARAIAIVQESGTTYGSSQTAGAGEKLFAIQYPPQISALRQAHAAQQKKRATAQSALIGSSELAMPTDKLTLSAEGLPTFAPQETSLVHDLALRDAGRLLKEQHIGDAIITGVLSQDIVFLAQRLRRESPDLRVVLYQMDRLFTASAFANDLRGALVVTPYPSFVADPAEYHTTFSRDSARSVAEVLSAFVTGVQPVKRLAIGVLSSGKLWPLHVQQLDTASGVYRRLAPGHREVPTMFKSFSCLVLAFGALNMLLLWVLQLSRDAASKQDKGRDTNERASVIHAQASAAWFLKGQLATSDPIVRPMHASMVATAQTALSALLALQAQLWFILIDDAEPGLQRVGRILMFGTSAIFSSACLGFALRAARGLLEPPVDPRSIAPADRELAREIRLWGRLLGVILPCAITLMTAGALYGIGIQAGANGSIFLDRVLNLTSGVSPYFVVALALVFLYGLGTTHAGRMRVIEVAAPSERVVVALALTSGSLLEARERELYASALLPGGVRYVIATLVSIAAPVLVVVQVRPGVLKHVHDFTLESWPLTLAMAIGMVVCWCGTVLAAALTVRLWRALSEVLHALLTSDLATSFDKLPEPFARSVAEQLALGPHDLAEIEALKRTLQSAVLNAGLGVPSLRPSDAALSPRMTSAMSAPGFLDAKLGAASARFLLDQGIKAKAAERLRKALATYVAFGLTRWIKQFRFLMWLATLGTTTMLLMSSGYVFSVRKLLVTLSVLLTVSVVAAVAVVFVGLERNRVLSFIGGSEPGVAIQANLVRILGWAVLPVTIAVASYFPDTMRVLIEWTMAMGSAR